MVLAHSLLTSGQCLHPSSRVTPSRGGRRQAASRRVIRAPAAMGVMLVAIASGVATGCFTHPINRAPVVLSIDQVAAFVRGGDVSFTARASDPDSDPVVVS